MSSEELARIQSELDPGDDIALRSISRDPILGSGSHAFGHGASGRSYTALVKRERAKGRLGAIKEPEMTRHKDAWERMQEAARKKPPSQEKLK